MKLLLIISLFICSCSYRSKCVRVIDGDTIVMEDKSHIRLAEIDALELHQDHGMEAKHFLESLILNKEVKVNVTGSDKYGRKVAEIYLNDVWINDEIVKAGECYVYRRFASEKLYNDELQAKANRIGIWAYNTEPPYIFRKHHK